ncbi:hypothetical protein HYALB_00007910 [Hymenoscyphus albidus]|uniref:Glycoside hydrolase family 65 protein n=1 Tax=Hymenoscyphus albidus TaxID=595503 RepID=A0A9N9LQ87_9HELO|nr:hypothetical protein HYALB_00007910 [Hymenoscyphus albidus]
MHFQNFIFYFALFLSLSQATNPKIPRQSIIQQFNPLRLASSDNTPIQVGNGDFAFGADVTGLQTFYPFGTLSSWGWHNFSLPTEQGESSVESFRGVDWWTHGRLVNYAQPNPSQPKISNWLIQNPQRINLGRIGFYFGDNVNITESQLESKTQTLDLYSGTIISSFVLLGQKVSVETTADPDSSTLGVKVESELVKMGKIGVFFDFPYPDVLKFDAPFVGVWNNVSLHTTSLRQAGDSAQIRHDIDATTYFTHIQWSSCSASISGPIPGTHSYVLQAKEDESADGKLDLTVNYTPRIEDASDQTASEISQKSKKWWENYWQTGAFISLPTSIPDAKELMRRTILSQYLLAVNSAGQDPPQESGLVNNGWYGKFHLEMTPWHLVHWNLWGKLELLSRSVPGVYERLLESSKERARNQGYGGAKWGKMSDPGGRSAPGEINSLVIWQQPHPMYFAELEWRSVGDGVLGKWDGILSETAEYMVSSAWWNVTTGVYDLGPPMYPVSENTNPNSTINPVFELSYWRFGLRIASTWKTRQNLPIPSSWTHVLENLAPLPITNGTYPIYENTPLMWIDPITYTDHPAMIGIYGLLPPTPDLNLTIIQNTADKIEQIWDFENLYGWDFPMLAMNAVRLGRKEKAIRYLLDDNFAFDDVGMPIGGPRVATPYFPGSGGLLWAMGMVAGGWEGVEGQQFPEAWELGVEGFGKVM